MNHEPEGFGPDEYGRRWDFDYGETEFIACSMEVGHAYTGDVERYWQRVDEWFERMYPERFDHGEQRAPITHVNSGQMGFKVALWQWIGEHNEQAQKDSETGTTYVHKHGG